MKWKQTSQQKDVVITPEITPVPQEIMDFYKDVTIGADVLFVNGVAMIITVSRHIHYGTIAPIPNLKSDTLAAKIKVSIAGYKKRGFNVQFLLVDKQFKGLISRLKGIVIVNVVSMKEHVPEVEQFIRTAKERARSTFSMVPYEKMPVRCVVELMFTVMFYLNAFPWPEGVSQTLSPASIVEGIKLDYNKHFRAIFGEYALVYEGTDNTMSERMTGAIALGPTGNLQGGSRWFSLTTG